MFDTTIRIANACMPGCDWRTFTAATLHEGVPGRHLKTALALKLDVPEFRRTV